jgi:hypothetical protein
VLLRVDKDLGDSLGTKFRSSALFLSEDTLAVLQLLPHITELKRCILLSLDSRKVVGMLRFDLLAQLLGGELGGIEAVEASPDNSESQLPLRLMRWRRLTWS